jgi:hypothetical protein
MMTLLLIFGIAFVLAWIPTVVIFLRTRRRFTGSRLVRCPETNRVAVIRLDATHAAATGLMGASELRVKSCSRWDGPVGHCFEGCLGEQEPLRTVGGRPA